MQCSKVEVASDSYIKEYPLSPCYSLYSYTVRCKKSKIDKGIPEVGQALKMSTWGISKQGSAVLQEMC